MIVRDRDVWPARSIVSRGDSLSSRRNPITLEPTKVHVPRFCIVGGFDARQTTFSTTVAVSLTACGFRVRGVPSH